MKKFIFFLSFFILTQFSVFAQLTPVDSTISGNITSDLVLSASKKYLLSGFVYVDSTKKIIIPAGTIIMGEKSTKGSLIIKRGAQIFAQGTVTNPIIFTSQQPAGLRQPGDWGGIIICGSAPNNQSVHKLVEGGVDAYYGGANPTDNSGIMQYVRIEYSGVAFQPNNETNGLTMGSVGSGTTIDHIQVSFCGDDAFEWFGGTVNCTHLIAFKCLDDDFDTDFGYTGKVQFGISYRDPYLADQSKSEAFESDNDATGSTNTPRTAPIFSNFTCIGPKELSSTSVNPNHFWGVHQRRNTRQSIHNSVFMGYNTGGILMDMGFGTVDQDTANWEFMDNLVTVTTAAGRTGGSINALAWFYNPSRRNDYLSTNAEVLLTNPYNSINPNLVPQSSSPVLNQANFTHSNLTTGFTTTTYIGAFGTSDRWDLGWTNYDPNSKVYNSNISWVSTIKLTNAQSESRFISFGRGNGATDGIDASFGETIFPPAGSDDIDIRLILPSTEHTALDIRSSSTTTTDFIIYKIQLKSGLPGSGNQTLKWDPNLLGAGMFILSDSLGGALVPTTNMKSSSSVTFVEAGNAALNLYIYVYTKFSPVLSYGNNWNLVSFPGQHPNSMSPDTLFRGRTSGVNVYYWNGTYQTATTLTPGIGYWMKHTGARVYSFNGTVQSSILYPKINYVPRNSYNVVSGWNIIGCYDYSANSANLTSIPSGIINSLVFSYTPGSGYGTAGLLEPGNGYWVSTSASGQIALPGPYSGTFFKGTNQNVINDKWGKIIVSDSRGCKYTLYAVNDGSNVSFYKLPPVPPAGEFDVRYSSERFVENLSGSEKNIVLSGVTYPITITAEGLDLRVRDAITNSFNQTVTNGNSYTIKSSANILSVTSSTELPTEFELAQNFPNPFNPSTTIKFSLPKNSNVTLNIYNSLGQKIDELVNNKMDAGKYEIVWNANKYASGVYFYELKTSEFTSLKKMIFIK